MLAEKYVSISPYVYVANNPIKLIDPNGMEIINGETENRKRLEEESNEKHKAFDDKYKGNSTLTKNDFKSKDEFKEYKSELRAIAKVDRELSASIKNEANIAAAIDNFKAVDPTNFSLANNLTFKDGDGKIQKLDVKILAGPASEYGGPVTRTTFSRNKDGSFNTIRHMNTIIDFNKITPIGHVLAHELGHAYGIAKQPAKSTLDTTTINYQDPANRNSFQSKTAMDWQERYDRLRLW